MNIRARQGAGSVSPELVAAITAAVHAFLELDLTTGPSKRREGISAWRMACHAGFGPARRGWLRRD